jgi:hypothetical protein
MQSSSRVRATGGHRIGASLLFAAGLLAMGILIPHESLSQSQVMNRGNDPGRSTDLPQTTGTQEIRGIVKVAVQADKPRGFLAPRALGVFVSAGDNPLMDAMMPQILQSSGVTTLRYPGGTYADNYHWSTYKPTKWQASET